jgi:methionyl aminopeptidase
MNDEELELFYEAGKIGARIREKSRKLVSPGKPILEIVQAIEHMIDDEGVAPAFPPTVCLNEIAAHFTPEIGSEIVIGEKDIVKVDLGVSLDGALSDTAYTVDIGGEYPDLIKACDESLNSAIKTIAPDVMAGEVGEVIEKTISSYGLRPIANLSGHMIERNTLHAGINIPNVGTKDSYALEEGDIFAVETFATDGAGYVDEVGKPAIFSAEEPSKMKIGRSRKIVEFIQNKYESLPFTDRWLIREFGSRLQVGLAMKELMANFSIVDHPPLKEVRGGMVSQSEHTILVTDSGCKVLTA